MADDTPTQSPTTQYTAEPSRFVVRSELMQHYATLSPIRRSNPTLLSARDAAGDVQLYTVGDDGDLYFVYRSARASTGWAIRPMHAPVAVQHAAVGSERLGPVVMLVCGDDGHVYFTTDEPWSAWVDLGTPFDAMSVLALRAGYGRQGELVFQAIARYAGQQTVIRIYPRDTDNPWDYVSTFMPSEIYDCAPGATEVGVGTWQTAADPSTQSNTITFYRDHQRQVFTAYSDRSDDVVALEGVPDAEGLTRLLCLTESGDVFYLDPRAPDDIASFSTEYFSGDALTFIGVRGSRVHVGPDADDRLLQLFALGYPQSAASGGTLPGGISLYHAAQQPDLESGGEADGEGPPALIWSPLVELAGDLAPSAHNLTVCRDGEGYTHGFTVGADGAVVHFWQDTTTDWKLEPVAFEFVGALVDGPAYSTEVTVVDESEAPVPGYPVAVSTSQSAAVTINGRDYQVGPGRGVVVQSDAAGRLTIVSPTSTMGTPSLQLSASFVSDGVVTILPNRYLQDYLYDQGATGLAQTLREDCYVDAEGNDVPLVDSAYDGYIDGAADAIVQSLSLAQPVTGEGGATAQVLSRRGDRAGVELLPRGAYGDRIDPARVAEQHWHIEFLSGGGVAFHRLADRAAHDALVAALGERARGSSHSGRPSWGSLWHAVRRGASALKDVVVSTVSAVETAVGAVVDRIEATLSVIVDGIETLLTYVVDTVQQVFDIVQGVFEAIAVRFEEIYRWLGTLFDWQQILDTHAAIARLLTDAIETRLPASLTALQETIDGFIGGLRAQLEDHEPTSDDPIGEVQQGAVGRVDTAPGPSSNWVQNQMLAADGGAPTSAPGGASAEQSALSTFAQAIEDAFGALYGEIVDAFQGAIAQARSIDQITARDIFSIVTRLLAEVALDGVEAVVDAVFALAQLVLAEAGALATTRWHIPVVSALYEELVGSELTLLDLVALALAVPTTFAANALGLDLSALGRAAGRPTTLELSAGGARVDEDVVALSKTLAACYTSCRTLYGPFAAALALDPVEGRSLRAVPALFSLAGLVLSNPLFLIGSRPFTPAQDATIGCWSISALSWLACTGLPLLNTKPWPALDVAVAGGSCVFGLLLMGGYVVQTGLQMADPSDYLPGATTAEAEVDAVAKFVQNIFIAAPAVMAPLVLPPFQPYGGRGWLAGGQLVGNIGGAIVGLVRVAAADANGYLDNVI